MVCVVVCGGLRWFEAVCSGLWWFVVLSPTLLKGEMPFKMHKIIYFFLEKKINKKKHVCLPYLKFSDMLPETHSFFYLAQ